jgi:hypothetical protein
MTTKSDKIAALKAEYPNIRIGSDETGYTELNAEDYEAKIAEWAENLLAKEAEELATIQAKQGLLTKLGITEDEAKLLLG